MYDDICKQPFVDVSDCTFYLEIRQKTDVSLFMGSLAGPSAGTTCCLHIFLILPPLASLPHPNLPESNHKNRILIVLVRLL